MPTTSRRRFVLVGLGGVGEKVLRGLVPFLHSLDRRAIVLAVDGDAFEERNRARMQFTRPGPKALVLAEELGAIYGDRVSILPVPHYLTSRNVPSYIRDGDVVFSQPDNHATRSLVEKRCKALRSVALFTGGNDGVEEGTTGTYGNVHVYLRARGRDRTSPLSRHHPEIARPRDRLPTARGCAAAIAGGAPQLLFTNAAVASAMLGAFYAWWIDRLQYEELALDVLLGRMAPVRAVSTRLR